MLELLWTIVDSWEAGPGQWSVVLNDFLCCGLLQVWISPVVFASPQDTEFKTSKTTLNWIHSLSDISMTKWDRDKGRKQVDTP